MRILLIFIASLLIETSFASNHDSIQPVWENELIKIRQLNDSLDLSFVGNNSVFSERWDILAQPLFWKRIMTLSTDSCVINIAKTREIILEMSVSDWDQFSDTEKDVLRDSIRAAHGLSSSDKVYMTTGKTDFYAFDRVIPTITKGVEVFTEQGVDPWYAQAILMIESPGKLAKSNAGAYGPFQLMASVARSHGLTVNKYVDERKDFVKSAQGASSLISNTCIPEAKKILEEHGLAYNENDLWFRLFVLHVYHAGARNVGAVVNAIQPKQSGPELIQEMWQTKAGKFGNASQNYTQVAIAALLILDELMWSSCDFVVENKLNPATKKVEEG